ncbi:MAG: hypothetical protein ACLKAK_11935 [Alkaliphilus sp.]
MPLPFIAAALAAKIILGATVATGTVGVVKGVQGVIKTKEANEVQERAEMIIEDAQNDMETQRSGTSEGIQKLGRLKLSICSNQLNSFVHKFSKIKNMNLQESNGLMELSKMTMDNNSLKEMKDVAINALDILGSSATGVGAGVLLGWGTYGGIMAIGTASTGTAIGTLSGVAATNATLAWLGGGALSVGGGMALGSAVLGGIVAGPVLLLAGGIFNAKAKEKLNNAYSNLSEARKLREEIRLAIIELEAILCRVEQNKKLLMKLKSRFNSSLRKLAIVVGKHTDWLQYSQEEKEVVAMAVKFAQAVKLVVDTPMLEENGELTFESEDILENEAILGLTAYIRE